MENGRREHRYESFGAYVRSQRQLARLTLRQAAALARISNPYLSQIEHGLTLPSVKVITALAEALQVSADTLLLRAAGRAAVVDGDRAADTEEAIRADSRLDDAQKQALLAVHAAFVGSSAPGSTSARRPPSGGTAQPAPRRKQPPKAPAQDRKVHDDV